MSITHDSTTVSPPGKPYEGFPFSPITTASGPRKIKGRLHYFGPWADYQAALTRWLIEKDDLEAGRKPQVSAGVALTVEQMVILFLEDRNLRVASGEMELASWKDYERVWQADAEGVR